jgi:hypothetical protein
VQHSVMNDVSLKEYAALVISEPYVLEMDRKVTTSPIGHQGWTAVLPSEDTKEGGRCEACCGYAETSSLSK